MVACWGKGCSCNVQWPYEVGLWHYIRKGRNDFYPVIIFKVGDGSSIKFWHDPWCEGLLSENNFPELYDIASNKEASRAEMMSSSGGTFHWNIRFIRLFQD